MVKLVDAKKPEMKRYLIGTILFVFENNAHEVHCPFAEEIIVYSHHKLFHHVS